MQEHGDALFRDFRAEYQLDIMECAYGQAMRPSEIVALIRWLPDTSAYAASRRGGREYFQWGHDRIVATLALETAEWAEFNFRRANTSPDKQRGWVEPVPIPIPGRVIPEKRKRDTGLMGTARRLFEQRKNKG